MPLLSAPAGKAIVKLAEPDQFHSNGLVIPDSAKKSSSEAVVVSSQVPDVEVGDRVLLESAHGYLPGATFSVEGVEYTTVNPAEILAVLEG